MKRRYLRAWHIWIPVVLLVAAVGRVSAALLPSFHLDHNAWEATDIVMAKTTTEGDTFEVVESWKGELQPAQRITIPQLRPAADAVPISLYPTEELYPRSDSISTKIPKQPPGSRLVLFLKRGNRPKPPLHADRQQEAQKWEAANMYHDMKTAAVWIDGGTFYCFVQTMNPGPSVLVRFSRYEQDKTGSEWKATAMTTGALRARVDYVIQIQRELKAAIQIDDLAARLAQLRTFVRSDVEPAQSLAFEELSKAGPSALRVLRAMLDDPEYKEVRTPVMHAYIQQGGAALGQELSARLKSELAFWKATGPSLAPGWWNEDALRQRYSYTVEILRGLATSRTASALSTAIELRDFWRSLPQLNNGLNLADECDQLVQDIRSQ